MATGGKPRRPKTRNLFSVLHLCAEAANVIIWRIPAVEKHEMARGYGELRSGLLVTAISTEMS